jgi:RNA polymerase sigma factor (sigma-70 family)
VRDVSDPAADLEAFYWRTWPRLIGVLVSIGGSPAEAEAVSQDAYVKLLGRWDAIRRYDDPEAWVRGLAVRTVITRLRRRQVVAQALVRLVGREQPDRGPAGDVAAALARITPEQRAVVVLYDVVELPVEQIAVELQLADGAVRSRLARARRALGPGLELTEYVDARTPEEAPPVEDVERAVQERRRRRYVVPTAAAAVLLVAGVAGGFLVSRTGTEPTIGLEMPQYVVDGPAPQHYKIGTTTILLRGEIAVTSATVDPEHLSVLSVGVEPDEVAIEPCLPNTVVRILAQDAYSVRIAAYRYGLGPDQNEGHQCTNPGPAPTTLRVNLQFVLGNRTVYAGSTGERVVLRPRGCLRPAGSFAPRCR